MKKILFYFVAINIILIFSCQEITDVGYDILPDDDKLDLVITDTITVRVHTYSMDTIAIDKVPSVLLGNYLDPYFHRSSANFAMQFNMETYPAFHDSLVADSVIITLPYTTATQKYCGDTTIQQTIEIYELVTNLESDSTYYSNQIPIYGDLIGTYTFTPIPGIDSVYVYEPDTIYKVVNKVKIKLNATVAEKFISAESSVYESNENFKSFFKGIYAKPADENNTNAIIKYDVNENTRLTVYYHYPSSSDEARSWNATANSSSCVRLNIFEHDYSETQFYDKLDDDTLPEDSIAYIQAMGGLRVKIDFPYIEKFRELENISIYRAELIVKTAAGVLSPEDNYPAVDKLIVTGVGTESEYYLLPEYIYGTQYLGVEYSEDNEYRFDLANHIKNIINGDVENNGLYIFPSAGSFNLGRSIITTGASNNSMKLVITYTNL